METLNSHLSSIIGAATESNTSRIALVSNANPKDYVYRYMFEKVTERASGRIAIIYVRRIKKANLVFLPNATTDASP